MQMHRKGPDVLKPVPFYFLRHGETDWNARSIIQGQTDTPLNENGLRQAAYAAPHVAALPLTTIVSSTLQRARRTAEIVNERCNLPLISLPELMECHLGDIQGQSSNGAWRAEWTAGGPMPGGETYAAYCARVVRGMAAALEYPGPVLIVGHGGNFWGLETHGLIAPGTRVPNCALFRLDPPVDSPFWKVTLLAAAPGESLAIGEAPAP
jgi:broad specificity phosphatase PhoE